MAFKWKILIFLLTLTAVWVFFKLDFREWRQPDDRNVQFISPQDKNSRDNNPDGQNIQNNKIQDKHIQDNYAQQQNVQEKSSQDPNVQDKSSQDQNVQDKSSQDQNVQDKSSQDQNVQDKSSQDQNVQDRSSQDQNVQDKSSQDQNVQDKSSQDQNVKDKNLQDQNVQDKSSQDQNVQDKSSQDQKVQDKNVQEKSSQDETSCGCQRCFSKDDKLLMSRLNPAIEPLLSANTKLTQDVFLWWKRLQYERRDFSYYKATVAKLFTMFPPVPNLGKPSPDKCRTCAVVGNSVNLKGSGYGSLIDGHDVIIRMNAGPTKGYEEDVGTKTTHHVMYPESAVDLDNSTHLVLFAFKIQDLEWPVKALTTGFYSKSYRKVTPKINANKDLVMVVNPAFMKYVHEVWMQRRGTYPSTGFMTLILALHVCDEVNVFGFGADSNGNWSHYFEVLKNKKYGTGPHSGSNEYTVLKQLASEKTVKLHKGS